MAIDKTIVILLGPPGSGKGTQAERLARELRLTPVSTGELLRRECAVDSPIGEQVRELLTAGFLVGNTLMNEIVERRLASDADTNGYILDGYPRTIEQAEFLEAMLERDGAAPPTVFDFIVAPEEVIARLSLRRQCPNCGRIYSAEFDVYGKDMMCDLDGTALVRRTDDNPDAIRERLNIYAHNARDLVEFYSPRRYFPINAMQSPDRIAAQLLSHMS